MNPFQDQKDLMLSFGQTVVGGSPDQFAMYIGLIHEEFEELIQAIDDVRRAGTALEQFESPDEVDQPTVKNLVDCAAQASKEAVDLIVVVTGFLWSMGVDPEKAWDAVHQSNVAKLDPETKKLRLREDGKVLKPEGWTPPDMHAVVLESWQEQANG